MFMCAEFINKVKSIVDKLTFDIFIMTIKKDKIKVIPSIDYIKNYKHMYVRDIDLHEKDLTDETAALSTISTEYRKFLVDTYKKAGKELNIVPEKNYGCVIDLVGLLEQEHKFRVRFKWYMCPSKPKLKQNVTQV